MKTKNQESKTRKPLAGTSGDDPPPLEDALIWLMRGGSSVTTHALREALEPHVDAGHCLEAFRRWAEENPEQGETTGADEARERRGLGILVDAALEQLVSEQSCEVEGEGGDRTARLDEAAVCARVGDMEFAETEAVQAGLAHLKAGDRKGERLADVVAAAVPGRWGEVTRALIVAEALGQVESCSGQTLGDDGGCPAPAPVATPGARAGEPLPLLEPLLALLSSEREVLVRMLPDRLRGQVPEGVGRAKFDEWAKKHTKEASYYEGETGREDHGILLMAQEAIAHLVDSGTCVVTGRSKDKMKVRLLDATAAVTPEPAAEAAAQAEAQVVAEAQPAAQEAQSTTAESVGIKEGDCLTGPPSVQKSSIGTREIKIDPEFAAVAPPHSAEEKAQLEANLVEAKTCRDPLVVWAGRGILLEGHARHSLCEKHSIPYQVVEINLPDRESAMLWIVNNQLGRRNLSPRAAKLWRGKVYNALKQGHGGARRGKGSTAQVEQTTTAEALGKLLGVSGPTLRREAKRAELEDRLAAACGPEAAREAVAGKAALSDGEVADLAKEGDPAALKRAAEAALEAKRANPKGTRAKPPQKEKAGPSKPTAKTIEVSTDAEAASLAKALFTTLGAAKAKEVHRELGDLLAKKER